MMLSWREAVDNPAEYQLVRGPHSAMAPGSRKTDKRSDIASLKNRPGKSFGTMRKNLECEHYIQEDVSTNWKLAPFSI